MTDADALLNTEEEPKAILVAVDASAGAPRLVSAAARLSRSLPQAVLHVAHVFRTGRLDRARAGAPVPASDAMDEAKEYLESQVRSARRQCRNDALGHFVVGDPTRELLKLCTELKVDLLVVGTHDHFGFERLLLGSIAERLVRDAGCSVLVVRPRAQSV
ncbi:MAG TPA: universal stress protein [Polyangiaceae bacterium]|jgi:nucleotide-binding universal stress UspA family protein